MTLPSPLRIMAALGLRGGCHFHQSQTPHYITCRDTHPHNPLLDDWPLLPLNQISNQITNDAGVPLDLEHAYTKLSDDALARSGGVLRMLPERRPITTFEGSMSALSLGSH
ncbi:hypothetical protein B9Z19DRAFT_1067066 [Tuber borchii]|uniref:Uncharacterized protein n=1 Tax=Tuber borchii TaxID=42251 RepID=A0A2T6ZK63_TUBBO|nr:hypothetical protein B9Z19DRAFT_1067066 [Tuber borchii]